MLGKWNHASNRHDNPNKRRGDVSMEREGYTRYNPHRTKSKAVTQ